MGTNYSEIGASPLPIAHLMPNTTPEVTNASVEAAIL